MNKVDQVRALFVPGGKVTCEDNTYHQRYVGHTFDVSSVGRSVWEPTESGFRGTFPTRVKDVLHVDGETATWKIGRDDHTVTYRKV